MIYTALTNRAMRIAYEAHAGQIDKCGTPYVFHPYHLAEQMPEEITVCVALLHDVVEDTPVTLEDLEREFPPEVTDALRLLTHDPSVPYHDYVNALLANPIARTVKRADLLHNLDETRFEGYGQPDEVALSQRRERYRTALAVLDEAERFSLMPEHLSTEAERAF
ncbi:MAG TPA: HD domain-containing protein [Candidatus Coprovicinus avistercoris]|uniref:HD domain-containing protein n=1 Tax=Candidatus Coprovicinus avistercoris TaxID=2840754 RepID=A0A9D1HXY1_9ACTN|nr:HD domain-containing protein [Candidatus Coprovicinus avistercoris]